jgi:hypothetical protein
MTVSGPVRGSLWAHKHVTIPVYVWQVTTIETMRSRLYHSEAHSHSWPYTLYLWRERTLGQVLEAMRCETRHPSRLRDSGHDRESYTNHARNLVFLESHFIESPCVSTGRRTLFGQAPGTLRVLARRSHRGMRHALRFREKSVCQRSGQNGAKIANCFSLLLILPFLRADPRFGTTGLYSRATFDRHSAALWIYIRYMILTTLIQASRITLVHTLGRPCRYIFAHIALRIH